MTDTWSKTVPIKFSEVPGALDFVSTGDFLGAKAASAPRVGQFIVFAMRYRRKKQGFPMISQPWWLPRRTAQERA
jgi:hypothetical protein